MRRLLLMSSLVALLVGCSGDAGGGSSDTGLDATTDTVSAGDTDADAVADTESSSDADEGSDTAVAPDTEADTAAGSGDTSGGLDADSGAEDTTSDTAAEDIGSDADADSADGSADISEPLLLTSPVMVDGGTMPARHTCDDAGLSPPFVWTGRPTGTAAYVLLATTLARDGKKWNWVLYNIAADRTELAEGVADGGTAGRTSDGPALAYAPPCSQGPGEKFYTFTLYALDAPLSFTGAPSTVTGDVVEAAMVGHILAESALTVGYTRPVP